MNGLETLLQSDVNDMRELVRAIGVSKTIRIDALSGTRSVLPPGGWASDIKLGVLNAKLADQILGSPDNWPTDVVQRAVEHLALAIAGRSAALAAVVDADQWFQTQ